MQIKPQNAKKFFILIGQVILSITELNFKANILHGNINTSMLYLKHKDGFKKIDENLESVITNFDRIVQNPIEYKAENDRIRYDLICRPPEMKKYTISLKDGSQLLHLYPYSKDFLEDVYALGITINNAISTFISDIEKTESYIRELKEISSKMVNGEEVPSDNTNRLSNLKKIDMKRVLFLYLEAMNKAKSKVFNDSYTDLKNAIEKTLKYLKVELPKNLI